MVGGNGEEEVNRSPKKGLVFRVCRIYPLKHFEFIILVIL